MDLRYGRGGKSYPSQLRPAVGRRSGFRQTSIFKMVRAFATKCFETRLRLGARRGDGRVDHAI
jgi:hypothetical protein